MLFSASSGMPANQITEQVAAATPQVERASPPPGVAAGVAPSFVSSEVPAGLTAASQPVQDP